MRYERPQGNTAPAPGVSSKRKALSKKVEGSISIVSAVGIELPIPGGNFVKYAVRRLQNADDQKCHPALSSCQRKPVRVLRALTNYRRRCRRERGHGGGGSCVHACLCVRVCVCVMSGWSKKIVDLHTMKRSQSCVSAARWQTEAQQTRQRGSFFLDLSTFTWRLIFQWWQFS